LRNCSASLLCDRRDTSSRSSTSRTM
jgi:hypothetical protein